VLHAHVEEPLDFITPGLSFKRMSLSSRRALTHENPPSRSPSDACSRFTGILRCLSRNVNGKAFTCASSLPFSFSVVESLFYFLKCLEFR